MVPRCGRRPLVPLNDSTNSPNKILKSPVRDAGKEARLETPKRRSPRFSTSESSDNSSSSSSSIGNDSKPPRLRIANARRPRRCRLLDDSPPQLFPEKPIRRQRSPHWTRSATRRNLLIANHDTDNDKKAAIDNKKNKKAINNNRKNDDMKNDVAIGAKRTVKRRRFIGRKAKDIAVCRLLQKNFKKSRKNSSLLDRWRNEVLVHESLPCIQLSGIEVLSKLTEDSVLTKRKDDSPDSAYSSGVSSLAPSRSSRSTDGTPPLSAFIDGSATNHDNQPKPETSQRGNEKRSRGVKRATLSHERRPPTKRAKNEKQNGRGVSYEGIRRMEYKDLFCEILPFVKPIYTQLANPPLPNLIGVDTSRNWLKTLSAMRLNEFVDVSEKEKAFFGLWNAFTMRRENRAVGCAGLPFMLKRFVDEFGETLVQKGLLFNFISHCACLCRSGFLSQEQTFDAMSLLERLKFAPFVPSNTTRRSPSQRSPTRHKQSNTARSLTNFFRVF